jgi:IS5 family transposase
VKRGRVKKPGLTLESRAQLTEGLLIPAFGTKSHINTDRRYRLIRRFQATHAAANDGTRLADLLHPEAFDSRVWTDTACRSHRNEPILATLGRRSMILVKKPKDRPMPGPHRRANRARSAVRSAIEHVFAEQKQRMKLFVRTTGLVRATVKIGMNNIAYSMKRLVWLERQFTTWPTRQAKATTARADQPA